MKYTARLGRVASQLLQRPGGITAGFSAIKEHMLPGGVRDMWNVELVSA